AGDAGVGDAGVGVGVDGGLPPHAAITMSGPTTAATWNGRLIFMRLSCRPAVYSRDSAVSPGGLRPLLLPAAGRRRFGPREREAGLKACATFGRIVAVTDQRRDELADHGSHLEAVARTAAGNPDVRRGWMAIDDEVRVGCRLVLADVGAEERRVRE